ncbi:MAG: pyruvate dehydrogenase (acetyl-transferring), homodimeric type, partial [Pirellulales bacterium]|nr:pyruvate dehydrogenase (acetyl-transferring), homodimeric type [Pirellulales bacterium]
MRSSELEKEHTGTSRTGYDDASTSGYNTPYVNTIPVERQPKFPGCHFTERRIKHLIRWNAMAMVVRANREYHGLGGHISTYASAATLWEVAFNHFLHARCKDHPGDVVYFQGHASPGVYARAYLEGRLNEQQLEHFRRESGKNNGLSSYPHPWLMPNFWELPTVSMGLSPIMAVYQARFLRYLHNRSLADTSKMRVWSFLGDGEMDEPESMGGLSLAARDRLDNLIFVVNCNLQRLDGPVRGNGKIIQELESIFHGAGWSCIKVIWGSDWDELLAADHDGLLRKRMEEVVDGQIQKYAVESGAYIRDNFFGTSPQLRAMVDHLSDEQLKKLNRGGHDSFKVYAAYDAAVRHRGGPTVILAQTIKGYGLGEAGEGKNITHKQKELNEQELLAFRDRFDIPLTDDGARDTPFYKPRESSPTMKYLHKYRQELGGYLPQRSFKPRSLEIPPLEDFRNLLKGGSEAATTMSLGRMLHKMLRDKNIGRRIVPIIPDEARTFGLEPLFRECGIYSPCGQKYEPVDSSQLIYYREAEDGQILEEGITEAGAMGSFIAAGTSYAILETPMIPFYLFYSMFGLQRVGDLVWAASDAQAKGFLLGCTAGRTTLNGEGLQHQDGHSQLTAASIPRLISYDPAYGYEVAVIVQDGLRRMYEDQESVFYYLTLYNQSYPQPPMPEGAAEGILRGMYKIQHYKPQGVPPRRRRPQLLASGPLVLEAERAAKILTERFSYEVDVWSVTSYSQLRREAMAVDRWNRLHPSNKRRSSYVQQCMQGIDGPIVAVSDFVAMVPEQIRAWVPGRYCTLGTDGFGRSDTRQVLRRHFEIDAEQIVLGALSALAEDGEFDSRKLPEV